MTFPEAARGDGAEKGVISEPKAGSREIHEAPGSIFLASPGSGKSENDMSSCWKLQKGPVAALSPPDYGSLNMVGRGFAGVDSPRLRSYAFFVESHEPEYKLHNMVCRGNSSPDRSAQIAEMSRDTSIRSYAKSCILQQIPANLDRADCCLEQHTFDCQDHVSRPDVEGREKCFLAEIDCPKQNRSNAFDCRNDKMFSVG